MEWSHFSLFYVLFCFCKNLFVRSIIYKWTLDIFVQLETLKLFSGSHVSWSPTLTFALAPTLDPGPLIHYFILSMLWLCEFKE